VTERPCDVCGQAFHAKRPHARLCSPRCRKAASRGTPKLALSKLRNPVTLCPMTLSLPKSPVRLSCPYRSDDLEHLKADPATVFPAAVERSSNDW
jgi:hypothetical protein